jgi:peptidoglycan/xylan/chitin deacetylase (PgdA/CDA1 family)
VWLRPCYGPVRWYFPEFPDTVFLTFDDGPHPQSTPRLLELLNDLNIKATFFCLGENSEKYPLLSETLRKEGHMVASHGYHHLDGWRCSWPVFQENALRGAAVHRSEWFRPPYGRLFPTYARRLKENGICTVLWDVLTGDYRPSSSPEGLVQRCLKYTQGGSVLVFHDKPHIWPILKEALPIVVRKLPSQGISRFSVFPPAPSSPAR